MFPAVGLSAPSKQPELALLLVVDVGSVGVGVGVG